MIPLIIQDQFYTIQNLQSSHIPQTSNWSGTFCAVSYSKLALVIEGNLKVKVLFLLLSAVCVCVWRGGESIVPFVPHFRWACFLTIHYAAIATLVKNILLQNTVPGEFDSVAYKKSSDMDCFVDLVSHQLLKCKVRSVEKETKENP